MRFLQWPYSTIHNNNFIKERDVITFYSVSSRSSSSSSSSGGGGGGGGGGSNSSSSSSSNTWCLLNCCD